MRVGGDRARGRRVREGGCTGAPIKRERGGVHRREEEEGRGRRRGAQVPPIKREGGGVYVCMYACMHVCMYACLGVRVYSSAFA